MPLLGGYTASPHTRMCCCGSSNQCEHSAGSAGRPRSFLKRHQTWGIPQRQLDRRPEIGLSGRSDVSSDTSSKFLKVCFSRAATFSPSRMKCRPRWWNLGTPRRSLVAASESLAEGLIPYRLQESVQELLAVEGVRVRRQCH